MVAEAETNFHDDLRTVDSFCFVYVQEIVENGEVQDFGLNRRDGGCGK